MTFQCKLGHVLTYLRSIWPCLDQSRRSRWSFICENFRKSYKFL